MKTVSTKRRSVAMHAGMLAIWFLAPPMSAAEPGRLTSEQLPGARRAAAHRPWRVIMNNDGNDSRGAKSPTRDEFVKSRSAALAGSQVDAIFYCTGIWGTFTHKSPTAELRTGADYGYKEWAAHLDRDGGPDALGTMVEFGHKNNIEVFWSLRMNDTHDSGDPTMMSQWKKAHPECLVGRWEDRATYRGGGKRWSAVDYTHPLVRDRTVGWFDEVAARYDVDGVELDFFRHPVFFKSLLKGEPATPAECDAMTSVVRRIREVIDRHAVRRGRPMLLAIRVPDSVGYCREIGLDVEQWLKDGLIDLMVASGYFRLNPWAASVELGRKYDVPVFAGLSESRFRDSELRAIRQSIEGYRGRAAQAWAAGVAGIYTFNLFDPASPVFRQLGDAEALATMDKLFTTGARPVGAARHWLLDGDRHLNRPRPLPEQPKTLQPGKAVECVLDVVDRLQGTGAIASLRLCVADVDAAGELHVAMNGVALDSGRKDGRWMEYPLAADAVKHGANRIAVTSKAAPGKSIVLHDLILRLDYPEQPVEVLGQ